MMKWKRLWVSLLAIPAVLLLEWIMAAISIWIAPDFITVLFGFPLLPFFLLELIYLAGSVRDLFLIGNYKENKIQVGILYLVNTLVNLLGIYIAGRLGLLWAIVIAMS